MPSARGDKVKITITEIMGAGICPFKLKPGNSWLIHGEGVPEHFCSWAFQSILPFLSVLRFGGEFPWGGEPGTATVCCPDPENPVVFKLERVPEDI